jgi:hypothetical protein
MTKQTVITLRLTSGELDVLASIARDGGRRESRQAALIQLLRREYRKACRAAGITPNARLLFLSPADNGLTLVDLNRQYETLGDILAAVQDAAKRSEEEEPEFNDYGQPDEIEPEEDEEWEDEEDDDFPGGWMAC